MHRDYVQILAMKITSARGVYSPVDSALYYTRNNEDKTASGTKLLNNKIPRKTFRRFIFRDDAPRLTDRRRGDDGSCRVSSIVPRVAIIDRRPDPIDPFAGPEIDRRESTGSPIIYDSGGRV